MSVVIILAVLGTALAAPSSRIVGGSNTTIDVYPFMVGMQYGHMEEYWYTACGGSLLTTTSILSAAHCYSTENEPVSWWRARIGTSYFFTGGTVHPVARITSHPSYNLTTLEHDIAIVRISKPAVYSNTVQPARIPGPNYELVENTKVIALGWGDTVIEEFAMQLQHVELDVINQEICTKRYADLKAQPGNENLFDITSEMFCSGILDVGGKDACGGDSGGPQVQHGNIVVGVISWGYGCAEPLYPGVSVRVSNYTSWIVANAS